MRSSTAGIVQTSNICPNLRSVTQTCDWVFSLQNCEKKVRNLLPPHPQIYLFFFIYGPRTEADPTSSKTLSVGLLEATDLNSFADAVTWGFDEVPVFGCIHRLMWWMSDRGQSTQWQWRLPPPLPPSPPTSALESVEWSILMRVVRWHT